MKTNYIFNFLDKQNTSDTLPVLFDILFENMEKIAPFGKSYEDAKAEWLRQIAPAMKREQRKIVLMYNSDALAGYAQYYTNDTIIMIEEIQLKPKYQRTMLLHQFCKFIKSIVPSEIAYIEAYADKRNTNSQKLMESLGMKVINDDGKYYHFRGLLKALKNQENNNENHRYI